MTTPPFSPSSPQPPGSIAIPFYPVSCSPANLRRPPAKEPPCSCFLFFCGLLHVDSIARTRSVSCHKACSGRVASRGVQHAEDRRSWDRVPSARSGVFFLVLSGADNGDPHVIDRASAKTTGDQSTRQGLQREDLSVFIFQSSPCSLQLGPCD